MRGTNIKGGFFGLLRDAGIRPTGSILVDSSVPVKQPTTQALPALRNLNPPPPGVQAGYVASIAPRATGPAM